MLNLISCALLLPAAFLGLPGQPDSEPGAHAKTDAEAGSSPPAEREGATPTSSSSAEYPNEAPSNYEATTLAGFRVRIASAWRSEHSIDARRVLAALRTDLDAVEKALPEAALALLRERVTFWISPSLRAREGFSGRGMCFHGSAEWLEANGLGGERVRGIEICNTGDYLLWRAEQPMMVLHELAHAYHDALPDDRAIAAAFEHARTSGVYEHVAHVLAEPGALRRAYALNNDREYFAELTEAYFGRNDFAPMTRSELRDADPQGYEMIERAWGLPAASVEPTPPSATGDAGHRRP